jgi:hypothetical protein
MEHVDKLLLSAPRSSIATLITGFSTFYLVVFISGVLTYTVNQSITFFLLTCFLPSLAFNIAIAFIFYKPMYILSYKIS